MDPNQTAPNEQFDPVHMIGKKGDRSTLADERPDYNCCECQEKLTQKVP